MFARGKHMKTRILLLALTISSVGFLYVAKARITDSPELPSEMQDQIVTIRVKEWTAPIKSSENPNETEFNEVRVVCLPRDIALSGAAQDMKKIGVHKTFPRPGGQGFCFAKFFYNPNKPAFARQKCGGRIRPQEYGHAYSTLNQIPCWVNYLDAQNIQDKVENPLKYAKYVDSLQEAINYLQTGLTSIAPVY